MKCSHLSIHFLLNVVTFSDFQYCFSHHPIGLIPAMPWIRKDNWDIHCTAKCIGQSQYSPIPWVDSVALFLDCHFSKSKQFAYDRFTVKECIGKIKSRPGIHYVSILNHKYSIKSDDPYLWPRLRHATVTDKTPNKTDKTPQVSFNIDVRCLLRRHKNQGFGVVYHELTTLRRIYFARVDLAARAK